MEVIRCVNCLRALPMHAGFDRNSQGWAGRCECCSDRAEFARADRPGNEPVRTPTRLPHPAWIVAEEWHAWRTTHEMLGWYQRVRGEQPQLTGRTLYQQVIIRWSGLDDEAAIGVLRRAYQRFCEWPCERELRFRDVVHYVVIDEYLRSQLNNLGTDTDMGKVVARLIPHDL